MQLSKYALVLLTFTMLHAAPTLAMQPAAIAFDSTQGMRVRWLAFMDLYHGTLPSQRIAHIEKALVDAEWYMRDAALKVLPQVSKTATIKWSRKLLADPSLIVRTQAAQNLKTYQDDQARQDLWKQLYAAENFRGHQSLWVRKHIVDALAQKPQENEVAKFKKILTDADESLHPYAQVALATLGN